MILQRSQKLINDLGSENQYFSFLLRDKMKCLSKAQLRLSQQWGCETQPSPCMLLDWTLLDCVDITVIRTVSLREICFQSTEA